MTTNGNEVTNVNQNNLMMSGYTVRLKLVFNLINANNDYHEVLIGTIPENYRPRTEEVFFYSDGSGTLLTFSVMPNGSILMYPSTIYGANTRAILSGTYI